VLDREPILAVLRRLIHNRYNSTRRCREH
jgi:hypothetical protein